MNWWKIFVGLLSIIQIILVVLAEVREDYSKASYEMLWFFFFTYLYYMEDKK